MCKRMPTQPILTRKLLVAMLTSERIFSSMTSKMNYKPFLGGEALITDITEDPLAQRGILVVGRKSVSI